MRVKNLGSVVGAAAVLLVSGSASAGLVPALGTDITVNDGINTIIKNGTSVGNTTGGTADSRGIVEDNETEPTTASGQDWDLEKFDLNGASLTAIGGFNFVDGVRSTSSGGDNDLVEAGDIFIRDPNVGSGYDYVYDMDYANGSYNIYDITGLGDEAFDLSTYVQLSNPYRIKEGYGTKVGEGFFQSYSGLADGLESGGMLGGEHYAITVDLMDLYAGVLYGGDKGAFRDFVATEGFEASFAAHLTMECGNDTLMGEGEYYGGDPVPEPATMLLFGTGLVGLAAIGRKKNAFRKKA